MTRKSTQIKTINDVHGATLNDNFVIQGTSNEITVATAAGAGINASTITIGIDSGFSGGGGTSASVMPVVYMDDGNVNVTTSTTTIPFDNEVLDPDGNATSPSDGKIRLAAAGVYRVSYSIPINDDAPSGDGGADRTRIYAFLQSCASDGFSSSVTTIAQSRAQVYTRENSGGSGVSASFLYQHTANDYIRLRIVAERTTNISTETGESQISISLVSGVGSKAPIIAATGATTLTNSQSGSVVYVTGSGAVTLPSSIEKGVQFVVINDTGSSLTPDLNSNTAVISGHGGMTDQTSRTYVAVSNGNVAFIG